MHRISEVVIENFRACKQVRLPLESFTPLVGQNNSGKSSILEAIQWVLQPAAVPAKDFLDAKQPVRVSACVNGVTDALLDAIPEQKHRKAIEPYCQGGTIWIRAIASVPGKKPEQEVWDVDKPLQGGLPTAWKPYPTGLPQAVSVLLPDGLYIRAMDDVQEDLGKAKAGTTIKELLDEVMTPVLNAHADLTQAINTIKSILTTTGANRSQHLKEFDLRATAAVGDFFPGLSLDLDLQVLDLKEFFKAGDLNVTDAITGDRRKFDQIGTGAQRAIQMALVRYLADVRQNDSKDVARRMLLIDEPELYLHPQGVRRLRHALHTLSGGRFQVVFSTHSPLMLDRANAADTVAVTKNNVAGVVTRQPLRQAVEKALGDAESQSRTLFELGNLAEIYFSDLVVICEGKTDRRLLPLAYERLYGRSPELDQIAFLSIGSCSDIPKALPVLDAMGIKACAVADIDFAFIDARKGAKPLLPKDGSDLVQTRVILQRLSQAHQFPLAPNGMPTKGPGNTAAEIWARFAADPEAAEIVRSANKTLCDKRVWIWTQGTIEDVIGEDDKGEDAILKQELRFRGIESAEISDKMPALGQCFEWLRSVKAGL